MNIGLRGMVMAAAFAGALAPAAATQAWAETVRLEVAGEAPANAAEARTRALDAAFVDAVSQALGRLVDAGTRRQHGDAITGATVRRARRFIRSYRVLEEHADEHRLRVRISAQVDLDRLREALAGAGVAVADEPLSAPPLAGASPAAVLLMRAHVGGEVLTTFGDQGGVAGRELAYRLGEQGFALSPVAADAAAAAGAQAGEPLDDSAAALVAREAGAEGAFVASLEVAPAERIRGTGLYGAAGRGILRVLDVAAAAPALVAEADVSAGGFADTPATALDQAAAALGRRLADAVTDAVAAHWVPSVVEEGALLVEVRGHRGWQHVDRIIEHLSRSSGIQRVWPRRIGAGGLVLAVDADVDGARARRRVTSALRQLSLAEVELAIDDAEDGLALTLEARPESAP